MLWMSQLRMLFWFVLHPQKYPPTHTIRPLSRVSITFSTWSHHVQCHPRWPIFTFSSMIGIFRYLMNINQLWRGQPTGVIFRLLLVNCYDALPMTLTHILPVIHVEFIRQNIRVLALFQWNRNYSDVCKETGYIICFNKRNTSVNLKLSQVFLRNWKYL